jgi:ABC-type Zn2+ transport system substrate-binding protein/surface adhesin
MKFLVMMMITMMAVSCAHKHDGKCHEGAAKTECGCDKEKSAGEKHGCSDGHEHKSHMKDADHDHDHDGKHKHDHGAMTMPPTNTMGDMVTQKISKEEFAKLYTKNKEKLGKSCTNPAMSYCGKTTKDMMVSENEASCLYTKVFRATRESLPELDGTSCAKMIKGFVKK